MALSDRQKNALSLVFVLAGLGLLAAQLWRAPAPRPEEEQSLSRLVHRPVDVARWLSSPGLTFRPGAPDLQETSILAVLVLHPKICTPALNEVVDYHERIEALRSRGARIRSLALVLDEDAQRAERFVKVTGLTMPVGIGRPELWSRLLGEAGEEMPQQLAFIRLDKRELFLLVEVPNTPTDSSVKEQALALALQESGNTGPSSRERI